MGTTVIDPGEETTVVLDLPMGMHTGMDGPHLFRITVPVQSEAGESGVMALYFQADFR